MTTEQSTLFHNEVSIEEARKQRLLEWRRKYYRDKLSKNPSYVNSNRKRASEYHAENRGIILDKNKVRYQENKEVHNKRVKKWQDANPDKVVQYKANYRRNNREELRSKNKEYAANNIESIKIKNARWRKENPDKNALKSRKYIARKKGASGNHTIDDINRLKALQRSLCAVCKSKLEKGYHVDHIIPLALGGSNDASNLQLLCRPCNTRKWAHDPIEFMQHQGFLL